MLYELPSICPVCSGGFHVQKLVCEKCGSTLEGGFRLDRLSRLPVEMRDFIIIFVQSRGNIREMEKYYNISYPTVRARLDEIAALLESREAGDNVNNEDDKGDSVNKPDDNGDSIIIPDDAGDDENDVEDEDEVEVEDEDEDEDEDESAGVNGDTSADAGDKTGPTRLEVLQMLARGEIEPDKAREIIENGGNQ